MEEETRRGALWMGLLLILVGGWFLVRQLLQPGPWYTASTLAVLTMGGIVAYFRSGRSPGWLAAVYLCGSWSAYAAVQALTHGLLPGSFLPAFWATGMLLLYALHTRPNRWPLVPAAVLAAAAAFFYVLGIGIATARYWIPVGLVLLGLHTIFRSRQETDT